MSNLQLKLKQFFSSSSKGEDRAQAVQKLAQPLQNRAEKVECHAKEMEKCAKAAEAEHSDQVDELRARADWYRAKADSLHRRRTFLILYEEWRGITAWNQIQKKKKEGKYPTICAKPIYEDESLITVLEKVLAFLEAGAQVVEDLVYVGHQCGIISVIATDSRAVIDTISIDMLDGIKVIAITPNGTRAYVTHGWWQITSSIFVIDTDINRVVATIPVGGSPMGVAITPDGTRVYGAVCLDEAPGSVIVVIATDSNQVMATIELNGDSPRPEEVAITPDGTKVYVVGTVGAFEGMIDIVWVIATDSNKLIATIPMKGMPYRIAITPDSTKVYVTNKLNYTISIIATDSNKVTVIIPVEGEPGEIVIAPDGARAYVILLWHNTVAVIDTNSNVMIDAIKGKEEKGVQERGENDYRGVAITRDGKQIYMTDLHGTVSVVDTASRAVIGTTDVRTSCSVVAIRQLTWQ
jgi:YVTN family beta-propeller protein